MVPIHELLSRIKWDPEFGNADFEIAYIDHESPVDVSVPLAAVTWSDALPGMFSLVDENGVTRQIPLHRIRRVSRNGIVVWQRPR